MNEILTESEISKLVAIEEQLATLSVEACRAATHSGYTRRQIAARMGISPSTLQRLLRGMAYSASLDTLARFAWACGYTLEVNFQEPMLQIPRG